MPPQSVLAVVLVLLQAVVVSLLAAVITSSPSTDTSKCSSEHHM
jgi:hypothetical protein